MMAAAQTGEVDCMRVLVKEVGCNKDAQDKVCNHLHAILLVHTVLNHACVHGSLIYNVYVHWLSYTIVCYTAETIIWVVQYCTHTSIPDMGEFLCQSV